MLAAGRRPHTRPASRISSPRIERYVTSPDRDRDRRRTRRSAHAGAAPRGRPPGSCPRRSRSPGRGDDPLAAPRRSRRARRRARPRTSASTTRAATRDGSRASCAPNWTRCSRIVSRRRRRSRPRAPRRRPNRTRSSPYRERRRASPTSDTIFAPPVAFTGLVSSTATHGGLRLFTATLNPRSSKCAVDAEPLRQPAAPGAVLAVRRVPRAGHDVRVALAAGVTARLRQAGRDQHVLVGERDRGAARQLPGHRLERRPRPRLPLRTTPMPHRIDGVPPMRSSEPSMRPWMSPSTGSRRPRAGRIRPGGRAPHR